MIIHRTLLSIISINLFSCCEYDNAKLIGKSLVHHIPLKEDFCRILKMKNITDGDYRHTKNCFENIWNLKAGVSTMVSTFKSIVKW